MSNFTDRLELEREQLIRSWKWRLQRNPMSKPWAQISRIVQSNGDAALDDKSLDSQQRQFHNMLGFRAWGGSAHKGGLCGGTIFRTPGFIRLEQRQFRKKPEGTKTIHIEHTYPVAMFAWRNQKNPILIRGGRSEMAIAAFGCYSAKGGRTALYWQCVSKMVWRSHSRAHRRIPKAVHAIRSHLGENRRHLECFRSRRGGPI